MMYTIKEISIKELKIIQSLAHQIWPICYKSILSSDQITYMLNTFYSLKNLENVFDNKHKFVVIYNQHNTALGFASFQHNCENSKKTKLHKLYVLTSEQNLGLGKNLIDYVIKKANSKGDTSVYLNVNRNNTAIDFYLKNNFKIINEEDISIGNGYLMEDYVMELKL